MYFYDLQNIIKISPTRNVNYTRFYVEPPDIAYLGIKKGSHLLSR